MVVVSSRSPALITSKEFPGLRQRFGTIDQYYSGWETPDDLIGCEFWLGNGKPHQWNFVIGGLSVQRIKVHLLRLAKVETVNSRDIQQIVHLVLAAPAEVNSDAAYFCRQTGVRRFQDLTILLRRDVYG